MAAFEPKYEIEEDLGVIDESKNTTVELKMIKWNGAEEARLDIRKWYPNQGKMGSGVALFTETGISNLITKLIEEGFGDVTEIYLALQNRKPRNLFDPFVEIPAKQVLNELTEEQLKEYEKQFFMYSED